MSETHPTRRRALRVVAAFAGLPLMIAGVRATAPKGQLHSWNGDVLGALSELTLWHTDNAPDIGSKARDVARALVDYRRIDSGAAAIGFARAGMAITLNSVAQGFITDAIADMLRNEGFESAVVDLGEYRTLGRHPEGHAWRLGIRDALSTNGVDRIVEL